MAEETPSKWTPMTLLHRITQELGLNAILSSPLDVKLLCLQRFVRLFAYGGSTLILVTYLSALDVSNKLIGLFMTLTLFGDVVISFFLTLIADQLGRRNVLALGAILMVASGIVFAQATNYYILLAAAILGVITPSGNEIGPFRAVEESAIAHLTTPDKRNHVFAWSALIGTGGAACGLISCGWTVTLLIQKRHWDPLDCYRLIFLAYAALGGVKFLLILCLSKGCEADPPTNIADADETAPLLQETGTVPAPQPSKKKTFTLLPDISPESRPILVQLCFLFAMDSFASGLAPMSWVTYYFHHHFSMPESQLGTLFFSTSILQSISVLLAASIATRIGNVKTMVFTHLPSAICLALIGIPTHLSLAITLVVLRSATQSMDTAPRSAFLSAIVRPGERTAVMGLVNVVKTASQSLGPSITGVLGGREMFWVAFLLAGCLKAAYDVGMLLTFVGHKERKADGSEEGSAR
ncbi:hypothetical protein LTR09_010507 [Extremus antarcticus]|uniref:Major facilitator superfamily (MFS) profile domain-containing protein n=1 Tax=Extremus antarcticus TaxID=702011 RepID=A0AAJ0G8D2_9PEZI|nr:hypothetical protein LTR09_010507 [Extremus antarcticus]